MNRICLISLISIAGIVFALPGRSQSDVTTNNIYFPASGNAPDGKPHARLNENWGVRFNSEVGTCVFSVNSSLLVGYQPTGQSWGTGNFYVEGNTGFGTTNPSEKLEVNGNIKLTNNTQNISWGQTISKIDEGYGIQFHGDDTHPVQITSSALLVGYNQTDFTVRSPGDLLISGKMGIGTDTPSNNHKLDVVGSIRSQEVVVEIASGSGPDYVFEEDYELRTLKDTEAYIQENKHLPEIPPASEMEEKGIALSEMNMKLLKKIEELTLHLIEQNKQVEALNAKNEELAQRLFLLERRE